LKSIKLFYKAINCLDGSEKKKLSIIFILIILTMFLEIFGISLILPVISSILNNNFNERFSFLNLGNFFSLKDHNISIVLIFFLTAFYVLKNLLLGYFSFINHNFSYKVHSRLCVKLFENYLFLNYFDHLKLNTSHIQKLILLDTGQFKTALLSGLTILTDFLVILGIISFLIYYHFQISIISLTIIFIAIILFNIIIICLSKKWGNLRMKFSGLANLYLSQSLSLIKEIKLFDSYNYFIKKFELSTSIFLKMERNNQVALSLARLWLEVIAAFLVFIILFLLLKEKSHTDNVVSSLALFGFAFFKMLPSSGRMLNSLQSLRFTAPVINQIYEKLKVCETFDKSSHFIREPKNFYSLELRNVNFSYNNKKILENLNFKIKKGDKIGLVGITGSGKSTFVDIVAGFLKTDSGKLLINDQMINDKSIKWLKNIGYIPQTISLLDATIEENIAFGVDKENIDRSKLRNAVSFANLDKFISSRSSGLQTQIGEKGLRISGGQRQRIAIARSFYFSPEFLILDEATSAIDVITEKKIINNLIKLNITLLIVSHKKEILSICDNVYELKNGKLIQNKKFKIK